MRFLRRDIIVSADNKGLIITRREETSSDGASNVRVLLRSLLAPPTLACASYVLPRRREKPPELKTHRTSVTY